MFISKIFFVFCLYAFSSIGDAFPFDLGGEEMRGPYGDCQIYNLGRGREATLMTKEQPLRNASELGFYPMSDQFVVLYLHIMLPEVIFKVKIEGSMMTLEECQKFVRPSCKVVAEEGVKHPDYIKSHFWNNVSVNIDHNLLAINVENKMVKSMAMVDYKNLQQAVWSVHLDEPGINTRKYQAPKPNVEYLVQFKCRETQTTKVTQAPHFTTARRDESYPTDFTTEITTEGSIDTTLVYTHETPAPHIEEPKKPEAEKDNLVGIIVGVIVAVIILIALAIVLYNVIKKRRSATLNEDAPLQKTTK